MASTASLQQELELRLRASMEKLTKQKMEKSKQKMEEARRKGRHDEDSDDSDSEEEDDNNNYEPSSSKQPALSLPIPTPTSSAMALHKEPATIPQPSMFPPNPPMNSNLRNFTNIPQMQQHMQQQMQQHMQQQMQHSTQHIPTIGNQDLTNFQLRSSAPFHPQVAGFTFQPFDALNAQNALPYSFSHIPHYPTYPQSHFAVSPQQNYASTGKESLANLMGPFEGKKQTFDIPTASKLTEIGGGVVAPFNHPTMEATKENSMQAQQVNSKKRQRTEPSSEEPGEDHGKQLLKKIKKKESKQPLKFSCSFPGCKRKFAWRWTMEAHSRTHLGDAGRTFICKQCGKGFFTKNCLKSHMNIHTRSPGEHKCTYEGCGKLYQTAEGLTLHIRNHHTTGKRLECPEAGCNKSFVRQADLRLHIIRVHCKEKPFPCKVPSCDKAFACLSELKRHLKSHKDNVHATQALHEMVSKKKKA